MHSTEYKVGLMLIVVIGLLMSMTFSVGNFSLFEDDGHLVRVIFDDTQGLKRSASVRVAGVNVGRVEDIVLLENKAHVYLRLQKSYPPPAVAKVMITSSGLMGKTYISLNPLASGGAMLQDNGDGVLTYQGELETGLQDIMSSVKDLADGLNKLVATSDSRIQAILNNVELMTGNMNGIMADNRADLHKIVLGIADMIAENRSNISSLTKNLSELSQELNSLVADNHGNIDTAIANITATTTSMRRDLDLVGRNMGKFTGDLVEISGQSKGQVEAMLANMVQATRSVEQLLAKVDSIVAKVDRGDGTIGQFINNPSIYNQMELRVKEFEGIGPEMKGAAASVNRMVNNLEQGEGTIGKLLTDDSLYVNLDSAVVSAKQTMDSVNKIVGKATAMKTYWGFRFDSHPANTAAQQDPFYTTSFIFRVEPRAGKFYQMEMNNRSVDEEDALATILVGQEILPRLQFKAGLIESNGGFGLDYIVSRNRFITGFEAFNFGSETKENAHLRFDNELRMYDNLYLTFGMDDLLNAEKSYYLGMQYFYEDKDLKYLFGLMPLAN